MLMACGGARPATVKEPGGIELPIAIDHEPCDLSRGRAIDVNGDGRADVIRVEVDGRESCRMIDLNFDGRPDAFVYFDEQGRTRRRESDFDRDGRVDEVAHYAQGVVVRKDRDTNLDGKFDTWDFYENGKLARRLRDTSGLGRVTQRWSFPKPERPECVVVESDRNGDGRFEAEDLIDNCAENHGAAAPAPPPPSSPMPEAAAGQGEERGERDATEAKPAAAAPEKEGSE